MSKNETYLQIAQIHIESINEGFLSSLGLPFMALLYEKIDLTPSGYLEVIEKDNQIIGFVSGTKNGLKPILKSMWSDKLPLFLALAPNLINPFKIIKIIEILFHSVGTKDENAFPKEELLSIAIRPQFRGLGLAEVLFQKLVSRFREYGSPSFKIIVGRDLIPAHKFYQKMKCKEVAKITIHSHKESSVYTYDVIDKDKI